MLSVAEVMGRCPWPHQESSYEHIHCLARAVCHRDHCDISLGPIKQVPMNILSGICCCIDHGTLPLDPSGRFLWTCSLPSTCCLLQRSWDIALGPIKQVPMNMFIMWMAGSSISIFPIMMVGMMFFRPIQAILAIQNSKCDCVLTMCVTLCVCVCVCVCTVSVTVFLCVYVTVTVCVCVCACLCNCVCARLCDCVHFTLCVFGSVVISQSRSSLLQLLKQSRGSRQRFRSWCTSWATWPVWPWPSISARSWDSCPHTPLIGSPLLNPSK